MIEIMKRLNVESLSLSRDKWIKYSSGHEQNDALIRSAARLVAQLNANGLKAIMFPYSPSERECINALAKELNLSKAIS